MTVRNAPMLTAHRRSGARAVHLVAGLALAACAALAACTNPPPPSKTFVLASLAASQDPNHNNLCNFANSERAVLQIGTATALDPMRVSDGAMQNGAATVNVTCSVSGSFDVNLSASLGGVQGGSLTIVGHVDGSSGGQNIHAVLTSPNSGGTFSQDTCTIAFTYGGGPVPQTPPIAPGRIWAHLSCPAMVNMSGQFVHLMDGTTPQETCTGAVDFIFENCS